MYCTHTYYILHITAQYVEMSHALLQSLKGSYNMRLWIDLSHILLDCSTYFFLFLLKDPVTLLNENIPRLDLI